MKKILLDEYLSYIQEDDLNEFDPITGSLVLGGVIASAFLIKNLIDFFSLTASLQKSLKTDSGLSKSINKILNSGNYWEIKILEDNTPNAFCAGGKYIYMTTGLKKILNKREIDAVLLHEAYHNKRKHTYKKIASDYPFSFMIYSTAIFIGTTIAPFTGVAAVIVLSNTYELLHAVTISRRQEIKSDEFAVIHGYGNELISSLTKLEKEVIKQRGKCGPICQVIEKIDKTLSTHPTLQERVQKILTRTKDLERAASTGSYSKIKNFIVKFLKK